MITIEELDGYQELWGWSQTYQAALKTRQGCESRNEHIAQMNIDVVAIRKFEEHVAKELRDCFARVVSPHIVEWVDRTKGLGYLTMGRLLGATGHPVVAQPFAIMGDDELPEEHKCGRTCRRADRRGPGEHLVEQQPFERTLRQWWAYCGYGDPTRMRRRGMSREEAMGLGNATAKSVVNTITAAQVRLTRGGPGHYRPLYDEAKLKYADRGWEPGHINGAALRLVGKTILRDLYTVARKDLDEPRATPEPSASTSGSACPEGGGSEAARPLTLVGGK